MKSPTKAKSPEKLKHIKSSPTKKPSNIKSPKRDASNGGRVRPRKPSKKDIIRIRSEERSAKIMEKFLSKSPMRPKPQSKASAKLRETSTENEEIEANNNINNNNEADISSKTTKQSGKENILEKSEIPSIEKDDSFEVEEPEISDIDSYSIPSSRPEYKTPNTVFNADETSPANDDAKKQTLFECKICFQLFPNRYFHRKHMLREHEDQLYECRVCSFNSVHPEKLKNHIIKLHVSRKEKVDQSDPNELQQELENLIEKKVPRKVIMEDGVPLGRDGKKRVRFVCALCSKRYSSKYALERHVRCHTLEKPYHCDVCDFSSSYKEHMMRHVTSVHLIVHSDEPMMKYVPRKKKAYEVKDEDEEEESPEPEAKKKRNILRKRFQCAVCSLKSTHKRDLMAHIREKHPNAHIESLKNNDGSKVHLIVTVAKKPKVSKKMTIKCTFCSLIFHDNWKYKVHLRSHTGVKPFRCSICSFRATSKMTVRDHVHRKHPDDLETAKIYLRAVGIDGAVEEIPMAIPWREFKCEICGENLKDNYALKIHRKRDHKEALPFTCKLCDHRGVNKAGMVKHCLQNHEGENLSEIIFHYDKPAKIGTTKLPACDICNKMFPYQSQLNQHLKLHTGERTFQCDHCPYKTNIKNLLTNHLLKQHFGVNQRRKRKTPTKIVEDEDISIEQESISREQESVPREPESVPRKRGRPKRAKASKKIT